MRPILPLILLLATACTPFPALQDRVSADAARADYPALVPLGPVLAAAEAQRLQPAPDAGLDGRIAALQARAAALRGAIIDGPTRNRMRAGIATGPLR